MKKTALHDLHISLGAKMAPFAGYAMPIQYQGILAEHHACRTRAALFDTCHMGEFRLWGSSACADINRICTADIASLKIGRCKYTLMCNEDGGVIDDLVVYRMDNEEYLLVVNAATEEGDFHWIASHLSPNTNIENRSAITAKIDLQGPYSPIIMAQLAHADIADLTYYGFGHYTCCGERVLVSRTGYTGEAGFEIYSSLERAGHIWRECMRLGATPAGLGARDTLRLEMGFPLYGHELTAERNAAESGFGMHIARDTPFIGSTAVRDRARPRNSLVGLLLDGRRAARHGDHILDGNGIPAGIVTSGSFAPSIGRAIALGYLPIDHATTGARVVIATGTQHIAAAVAKRPLYAGGTSRTPIAELRARFQ